MPPGGQGERLITATLAAQVLGSHPIRAGDAACGPVAWTVAAPGPPCHCWAVNAGPVSAGARRICLVLAVAGTVLLMSDVLLVVASGILPGSSRGWRPATLIALGLIACGLFCGAVLVAVAVPGSRRAGRLVSPVTAYPRRAERPGRTARSGRPARLLSRPAPETGPEGWAAPGAAPAQGGWAAPGGPPAQAGWAAPGAPPADGVSEPQTRTAPQAALARPAPEEEWMRALRPDGPPPIRRPPSQPGGDHS